MALWQKSRQQIWAVVLALLTLAAASSCISYKRAEGAWAKPLGLSADPKLLALVPVDVLCAIPRKEPGKAATRLELTESSICNDIKLALQDRGFEVRNLELEEAEGDESDQEKTTQEATQEANEDATIEDPDSTDNAPTTANDQETDASSAAESFTLVYVFNKAKRDNCGWTLVTAILTFSLLPCLEDVYSTAEIRILDPQGLVKARYPLKLVVRNIYGIGALYYHGLEYLRADKREDYHRDLQRRLVLYVGDIAISYVSRDHEVVAIPSTVNGHRQRGG